MSNLLNNIENISDILIEKSIEKSYLDYSMSVILGRALPDARDGLKPVHRRILYAMNELNLYHKNSYKKSARIIGDVIGKYHPHGDNSVYDALVRMAQNFSLRFPLVDGQGNFGSIDGDNPAAMRYTEVRMTKIAEELLTDLDKDTVNFIPNYDDSSIEPDVLPSKIPNLLLNGSSGIAVGMATNIPPHRIDEIIEALQQRVKNPECTDDEILNIIKGPDFPTGGTIFGKKGITEAYKTGKGKIKVRAKTHIEESGNRDIIIIDEIPYQVNKSILIENIANLARDKAIEGILEIRDESDRDGIRIVIELKRDSITDIVLNNLFKKTNMQVTFGIIMLAIHNKEPKVFSLMELLDVFINHRKTIIIRKTIFDLQKSKSRVHILEGLIKAVQNINKIIKTIQNSENIDITKNDLIESFKLTDIQANAILDMRLRRLTELEHKKIENEAEKLYDNIKTLDSILKNENILDNIIYKELKEIKENFTSERRTNIIDDYDDIDIEDLIVNEPMVITITHRGYIKRVPTSSYSKQNRGGKGKIAITVYEDDFIEQFFTSNTLDTLIFITDFGRLYKLKVYKIPEVSRIAKGKAVVNLINLQENEKIVTILPTQNFDSNKSLSFFTKNGVVKKTNLSEYSNNRANGVKAINLDENDFVVDVKVLDENSKTIFLITKKGQSIRFNTEDVRTIGKVGRGVKGIKFKIDGDYVCGVEIIEDEEKELLIIGDRGLGKRTLVSEYRKQNRAGTGVIAMKLTQKTGNVVGVVLVSEKEDLMCLTKNGKMIRIDMAGIRKTGRNASGVKIISIDKKDMVIDISKCPKEEEEETDIEIINNNLF